MSLVSNLETRPKSLLRETALAHAEIFSLMAMLMGFLPYFYTGDEFTSRCRQPDSPSLFILPILIHIIV